MIGRYSRFFLIDGPFRITALEALPYRQDDSPWKARKLAYRQKGEIRRLRARLAGGFQVQGVLDECDHLVRRGGRINNKVGRITI